MSFQVEVREKIAALQQRWRDDLAADIQASLGRTSVPPAILASVVMALLIGLGGQVAANPQAFDTKRMHATLTKMLAPLFGED
jgi:hypothetical protein